MKKDPIQLLEQIQATEVSPFVFTRIQAKVQEQLLERLSTKRSVVYISGIVAIIVLNVLVLRTKNDTNKNMNLVSEMNLVPTNQLYP